MKLIRLTPFALASALVACGGSAASTQDFRSNAPTYDKMAIAQNDGDTAPPVAPPGNNGGIVQDTTAAASPDCHPHLFQRTDAIIGRVNRHFYKLLAHVEQLIKDNPAAARAGSATWENVRDGVDRKLTMTATANADGSTTYDFELDVAAVVASGSESFVKVMSGSLTHAGPATGEVADAGAGVLVEDKGSVTYDFSALASVVKTEKARGQITDTFDNVHDPVKGEKRSANLQLTGFLPEEGDLHGPRTGSYTWEREPGTGGMFRFEDTLVLYCLPNSTGAQSDLTSVARWYKGTDGAVHGRSDARATGGQLPSGDLWMGVTCAQGRTTAAPAEGYWMIKLEDPAGATVAGNADQTGVSPCDPAFGPVPALANSSTDYDFSAAVSFPGEW